MKRYEKLCSCLMIVALCVAGLALGGCKKAREKRHDLSVATGAVVNSMMTTNPMGALFGVSSNSSAAQEAGVQTMASLTGCPIIQLQLVLDPPNLFTQNITITYSESCLVNGIAMSGTVHGQWAVKIDEEFTPYLESNLTIDNMTMEGLVTEGTIHQLLYVRNHSPFAQIDGDITTTHADGRTRSIVYDNLTAEIDLSDALCFYLHCDNDTVEPALVINGSATYTDEDGNTYAMDFDNVTQQLSCPMPTSGTVHLVNTVEEFDAIIDYGDGACDSIVTVTLLGEEPKEVDVTEYVNKHQYRF